MTQRWTRAKRLGSSTTRAKHPPWANSLGEYETSHKMAADPLSISCCNGASSNRVPTSSKKSGGSKNATRQRRSTEGSKRELVLAEDAQQYARVGKRLGDGRFELTCLGDGQLRLGHVRGKMWKRVWICTSDLVLVALRGYQDQKVDIVHKFTGDEERLLLQTGEIRPEAAQRGVEDDAYEQGLQAVRDVHGASRVGLDPSTLDDVFDFDVEAE